MTPVVAEISYRLDGAAVTEPDDAIEYYLVTTPEWVMPPAKQICRGPEWCALISAPFWWMTGLIFRRSEA